MLPISAPTPRKFKVWAELVIKNNYLYPVDVDCYIMQPKANTNNVILTALQVGLTDAAMPSINSWHDINFYPSDSVNFMDQFKMLRACPTKRLSAGDEIVESYSDEIVYDPALQGRENLSYRKSDTRFFLVRIQGTVAHDSTLSTNVGTSNARVDMMVRRKFKTSYPNPVAGRYLYSTQGLNSMEVPVVGIASAEIETSIV